MSRHTLGHHWLGKRHADLTKHKGVAPWEVVYIYMGAQGLWSRPLPVFKMAKDSAKWSKASIFSTFSQPEDRCFRLETRKLRRAT